MRTLNLIAVVLADGSIDRKRYTVTFTESHELVKKLVRDFKTIEGLKIIWSVSPQKNSLRARAYSKKLVEILSKYISSTRTRPTATHPIDPENKNLSMKDPRVKLPKECFNKSNARKFLKYYASCDGGPEFSGYRRSSGPLQISCGIKIGCKNVHVKKQLKKLFGFFDIAANERSDGLEIRSADNIRKFLNEVGFLEETKVRKSKYFNCIAKNDVLRTMLLCSNLSNGREWITSNFESVEALMNFLRKCAELIQNENSNGLHKHCFETLGIEIEN